MSTYAMVDHTGTRFNPRTPRRDGLHLHCATGGSGDPGCLVHGAPGPVVVVVSARS